MPTPLSPSAGKFQEILFNLGFACEVVELPTSTRTAQEAATAAGCKVAQIVKSLIFRGKDSHRPVLVVASGSNRVNEQRLAELLSEPVEKPDATFVREKTGFSIGGVPPVGHPEKLRTFIDEDLFQHQEIWAAAGTPNAIFKLSPDDLQKMTGGQVVSIK